MSWGLIDRLGGKLKNLIGKGTTNLVDCSGDIRRVQSTYTSAEDTHDDMPAPEQYGHASWPPAGLPNVTVFPAGDRSGGIVIMVVDNQYRIELAAGEVAVYDDLGQVVHLARSGIRIESPLNVTVKAGQTLRLEGDVVQLHARTLYRFDTNGHGQVWHPTSVDTWQIGETAGTPHPITPPEIS